MSLSGIENIVIKFFSCSYNAHANVLLSLSPSLSLSLSLSLSRPFLSRHIADCSHWVQQDAPEEVNQSMREFLQE